MVLFGVHEPRVGNAAMHDRPDAMITRREFVERTPVEFTHTIVELSWLQ